MQPDHQSPTPKTLQKSRLIVLSSLFLFTACSSSQVNNASAGGTIPAVATVSTPQEVAKTAQANPVAARLHFTLPAASALSGASTLRSRQYISGTNSQLTITVTPFGGSPTVFGPTACTSGSCAINFTALPGANTIAFAFTGGGNTLSRFTTTTIIQPATATTLNFSADPVVDSVILGLGAASTNAGTPASIVLTVNARDAAGNTIVGTDRYVDVNGNPVAISLNVANNQAGGSGNVSIVGPPRITGPNQASVYAKYNGAWLDNAVISPVTNSSTITNLTSTTLTATPRFFEYPTPSGGSVEDITSGPDGNLWFAERSASKIGRITPSGVVTEFTPPTASSTPLGIVAGPDGNLWIPGYTNVKIMRLTPGGTFTEFPFPGAFYACYIAAGSDGNVWTVEDVGNRVDRITMSGTVTSYAIPTGGGAGNGIAAGADGNMWFIEVSANKIGRVTPQGRITEYSIPTSSAGRTETCGLPNSTPARSDALLRAE